LNPDDQGSHLVSLLAAPILVKYNKIGLIGWAALWPCWEPVCFGEYGKAKKPIPEI